MRIKQWFTCFVLLATASVANASLISIDTSTIPEGKLNPGDMVTLTLFGDDFDLATIGGGVNLRFEPTVLRVDDVSFDNSDFDFRKQVNLIDNDQGLVESILVASVLSEHDGLFTIAEIKFTAIGVGTSDLKLEASSFFAPWRTAGNADIAFDFVDTSLQVVPVPAAVWLFLSGIGLLGAIGKRKS